MAAKHDIQRGITAHVAASPESIGDACRRAAGTLKNAEVSANGRKVTVKIIVGTLGQALVGSRKGRSTVVGITLGGSNGRVALETNVENYTTIQSRVFGFVPAGPKRLWGREAYFKFLDALENELRVLDPGAEIQRRQPQR
jgi:hypothetical protein